MNNPLSTSLYALMLTVAVVPFAQTATVAEALAAKPSPSIVATSKNLLASGQFVTVDQAHATTGNARIVDKDGQRYLEFDAAFDTARGPAVQVILHKGNSVPVSLNEADYVYVGDLQSFDGAQRYLLPADLNLDDYESVAIWCQEFNVTFGYADI